MERVEGIPKVTLFERTKALIFKIGCEIYLTLTRQKDIAKESAHQMNYREESCYFDGLSETLKGIKILFLTDPHIGGNIDTDATEISKHIDVLLGDAHPEKTLVLHGGDFICSESGGFSTSEHHFLSVYQELFVGLSQYQQFGVIGNHDDANPSFSKIRRHLEHRTMEFLEKPEDTRTIEMNGTSIAIHGIHTLATFLHDQTKEERNVLLDKYITLLNTDTEELHIVLLHNPDGLEFLLERLQETHRILTKPTLFLAGHTHGAMFDVPLLRHIGLKACSTQYGRYKGWYGPEKEYADTGNWKLYVSTGMGNSRDFTYRINAEPEVVLFKL